MSASFFALATALAGFLHYIFQVFASQQLSANDFAAFSFWLAQVSILFMAGGLFQYAGNFYPTSSSVAKISMLLAILGSWILMVIWFAFPDGSLSLSRGLLAVIAACLFGWISGIVQQRMFFFFLGGLNLGMASFKILVVFLPEVFWSEALQKFSFAVLAGYAPALTLIGLLLWWNRSLDRETSVSRRKMGANIWAAPIILSIIGAVIPQMDIVVLKFWSPQSVFEDFVRASLFYKGIYFLMFILAQLMLPRQIANSKEGTGNPLFSFQLGLVGLVVSAGLAFVAPLIQSWILRWDTLPPQSMVFYTCFNMSILTWLFLIVQEACARNKIRLAAMSVGGIAAILGLQALLKWPVEKYFQLAISAHLLIVVAMIYKLKPKTQRR